MKAVHPVLDEKRCAACGQCALVCAPMVLASTDGWVVYSTRPAVEDLRDRVLAFYARLFKTVRNPVGKLAVRAYAGAEAAQTLTDYLPVAEEAGRRLEKGEDRLRPTTPRW